MAISHRYHTDRAKLALELTMRDALAGVEELAYMDLYRFDAGCLEILGIEPPQVEKSLAAPNAQPPVSAVILHFSERQRRAV